MPRNVVFVAPFPTDITMRFVRAAARLPDVRLLGVVHTPPDEAAYHDFVKVTDPLATQDIIDATENPEITIAVALRSISWKVQVRAIRPLREIGLNVSLVVTPDSAQHRRPRLREREKSTTDLDALSR